MKLVIKEGGIRKFKLDKKLSVKGLKLRAEMLKLWESYDNIPMLFIVGMDIKKTGSSETLNIHLPDKKGLGYWIVMESNFMSVSENIEGDAEEVI